MRTVSFYHKDTGVLHRSQLIVSSDALVALNTPKDHIALEGHYDADQYRVNLETGQLVWYQPAQPSPDHEWNEDDKRWQLTPAASDRIHRRAIAISRIASLETAQHRVVREHALGLSGAVARLQAIDDEIASLRSHL